MEGILSSVPPPFSIVSGCLTLAILAAYVIAALKQRQWSRWRITFFVIGCLILLLAVSPVIVRWAHHELKGHMVQHLLIGMLAPLGLVLGAPMTLALRTLPADLAKRVVSLLHSRPVQIVSHPVSALMLNIGGMYVLYLTPLYATMQHSPMLHHLVHIHFLAAGYLFTWSILAGPDSSPHSPEMWTRLSVLTASIAAHAVLGKLMYGYLWPRQTGHTAEEIQAAAQIMYYGGDTIELILAVALFYLWYQSGGSGRYSLHPLLK